MAALVVNIPGSNGQDGTNPGDPAGPGQSILYTFAGAPAPDGLDITVSGGTGGNGGFNQFEPSILAGAGGSGGQASISVTNVTFDAVAGEGFLLHAKATGGNGGNGGTDAGGGNFGATEFWDDKIVSHGSDVTLSQEAYAGDGGSADQKNGEDPNGGLGGNAGGSASDELLGNTILFAKGEAATLTLHQFAQGGDAGTGGFGNGISTQEMSGGIESNTVKGAGEIDITFQADAGDGGDGTALIQNNGFYMTAGHVFDLEIQLNGVASSTVTISGNTFNGGTGGSRFVFDYQGPSDLGEPVVFDLVHHRLLVDGDSNTFVNFDDVHVTGVADSEIIGGSTAANFDCGDGNDTVNLSRGGADSVNGGGGDDTFVMGGALTAADTLNGGSGNDTVTLKGDYATGLTFGASTMLAVENLSLARGHSYTLTTVDATVASGQTLTVDGSALAAGNVLTFDGSAENDGSFAITGGAGNDVITGGASGNTITGGHGADHMTAGAGVDVFAWAGATDSTGATYDTITGFDFSADFFKLPSSVGAVDAAVVTGSLSAATFNADLAAAITAGHLQKGGAVLFTPDSGSLAGDTFLIVDLNGHAGYQPSHDLVVRLDAAVNIASMGLGDFI